MNERMDEFDRRLADLERRFAANRGGSASSYAGIPAGVEPSLTRSEGRIAPLPPVDEEETPLVRHNRLGERYSIKLVYPGFYLTMTHGADTCAVGFPTMKEKLAKRAKPGHLFFIYVTSPEQRIIGLAQVLGPAEFLPERDFKRPWVLDLAWVLGPKIPGVRFSEIGLRVKARIGDSIYGITDGVAGALTEKLGDMAALDQCGLERQKEKYRMYR